MTTAAGLPLPSLSRGRFAYTDPNCAALASGCASAALEGELYAYTDQALLAACGVRIAFTERSGGQSTGPYSSLNLKHGLGDEAQNVESNRTAVLQALSGNAALPTITPNQVHGTHIVQATSNSGSEVLAVQEQAERGCDAVVVDCLGVAGLLCFADCLPLILVAPTAAFSVVHCGWKGTLAHLASKAAQALVQQSGCAPASINAYIGAYIHAECFEVEEDVAQDFLYNFEPGVAYCNSETGKWHVDLGAAVRHDLFSCGISSERVSDINKCTVCNKERFFSYRASGGTCGRHGALAVQIEH